MFLSALPIGVFSYFLYQPPSGLSETQLFAWFTVTYVGVHLSKSFYLVPHSALGAELTDDYDERNRLIPKRIAEPSKMVWYAPFFHWADEFSLCR